MFKDLGDYLRLAVRYLDACPSCSERGLRIVIPVSSDGLPDGPLAGKSGYIEAVRELKMLAERAESLGRRVDFSDPQVERGKVVSYIKLPLKEREK